jgi:hypothetical protein
VFFGDLLHRFMVARLRVHSVEMPELKWFLADDER